MIYYSETYNDGVLVERVEYDTNTETVTTTPPGETRPMTFEESYSFSVRENTDLAAENTTKMVVESDETVDRLVAVVNRLNTIKSSDPIITELMDMMKIIARQTIRQARLTSSRTEDTYTGRKVWIERTT